MTLGYDISDVSHTVYGSTSSMSAGDAGNATTFRERTFHEINPGDWRTSGVARRSRLRIMTGYEEIVQQSAEYRYRMKLKFWSKLK